MGKRRGRRPTVPRSESEPLVGKDGLHGADDVCKDGGKLVICGGYSNCTKSYHTRCLAKDEDSSRDDFTCRWHTCLFCKKPSSCQCFCCSVSFCVSCLTEAQFVRFGETKGFCINCLNIVVMIERNDDVSDGVKVDFDDRSSYEYLFKVYWKALNRKECLELDQLEMAYKNSEDDSDSFMKKKTRTNEL